MSVELYRKALCKIHILLLTVIVILNVSFGQTPKTSYKITGYTLQKEGKARLLLYTNRSQFLPYDSADIKNGIFTFKGTLDEPKSFQLLIGNKGRILFIGNETIVVNDRNKNGAITVSGSKLSNDYDYYFNRWIAPLINRSQAIDQKLDSLDATHQNEIDSLTRMQGSLFNDVPDSSSVFIRQKPSSFVSLYLLNYNSDSYPIDTVAKLFHHLDTSLKQYPSAQFIKNKANSGSSLLTSCPPFSATDENGHLITSEIFKGKYLLIHFWASWNNAYAKNLSLLQKVAERFQNQNFKVLTASLDNDTSTWKTTLRQYHISEHAINVFLPNQFRNPMVLQFGVAVIPRTILIDPGGNIIESNIDPEKINSRLEKIFTVSVEGNDDVALSQPRASLNR